MFGSEKFVNEICERNRSLFGKSRRSGARTLRQADWDGLCVLRDLRDEVLHPTRATRRI